MKVLFAIRDDNNIVDTIVRKYQRDYNKKIVYKEVKNFTAILRELQQNNNYDRIIIGDDIDQKINKSENKSKLILTKLKSIKSRALKNEKQIPIIFLSDNNKITKYLYELNIYNGIIGTDITKKRIYELMLNPRNKLQAKEYYKINEEVVNKNKKTVEKVNKKNIENKIKKDEKNIAKSEKNKITDTNKDKSNKSVSNVEKTVKYLNQVGLSEEKYVKKFDDICSKLSKEELQIIIKSLSLRTKKILKNNSSKYNKLTSITEKNNEKSEKTKVNEDGTVKRGRGRPRKEKNEEEPVVKRKRGRPRKTVEKIEDNELIKKNVEENKEKKAKAENKKKIEEKSKKIKKEKNENNEDDLEEDELLNKEKKLKTKNKEKIKDNLDEINENKVEDDEFELDKKDIYNYAEDDDDLDLDEDNEEDIEDDDDLDLDEDNEEDIEDDDDLDLDKDNEEDIEDDDDLDLDEDDEEDIEDDDDLDLDEDDEEDIEDDNHLDLDEDDEEDTEDDNDLNLDENDEDDTENDALSKKENTNNSLTINNNVKDDEIFDLDDNDFYDDKNAKSSENKNDDDFVFDVDDEKSDDEDSDNSLNLVSDTDDDILSLDDDDLKVDDNQIGINQPGQFSGIRNKNYNPNYDISRQINEINGNTDNEMTEGVKKIIIPNEKKIAAFVGAHGNGTSFIINNLALLLSEQGIKTAIVDLTKNKNSYYIFTQNEERLRAIAYSCFEKLKSGISDGIIMNKNLTVYTSLPNADSEIENKETAINTLLSEFSLVLFDCDTETDQEYFEIAQDIYLVQSLDVLTIQPLTTFLKKLKMNKLLNEEKLRILINKDLRVNELNERKLISAMSVYNSPDTTYQLDLFNRDKIGYLTIPFEEKNYSKYLDELADCKLTIRGYSKNLISSFNKLAKFVYPINGKKRK